MMIFNKPKYTINPKLFSENLEKIDTRMFDCICIVAELLKWITIVEPFTCNTNLEMIDFDNLQFSPCCYWDQHVSYRIETKTD